MASDSRDVLARIDTEKERYLEELKEYIRIPSISTDPDFKDEVLRAGDFLVGKMREAGLTAERIDTAGHPLVYGEWLGAPGKPTVLFYGHYDVQPVDPIELWRNPPFEPTVEGDKLVARGATDDKGQSYAHLKAVAALLAERGRLPVNVKFLVEGEEEAGGQAIDEYVKKDGGKRLKADAVVISDSSLFAPGQPSLVYGLRGLCYMEIKVTGPNRDLHSGTYRRRGVESAQRPLPHRRRPARRDDRQDPDPRLLRRRAPARGLGARGVRQAALGRGRLPRRSSACPACSARRGTPPASAPAARPTCDVNGIFGGYMGKGAKTVLPSWGGAKVSMRLVPDQDPEKIARLFTAHVKALAPAGVDRRGDRISTAALRSSWRSKGPIVDAALDAMEEVWGARPVRIREGGSIPIVSTFASVLQCPVLLLGFGLNDDGLHSPNEKFNISHFYNGIRSIARLLDRLSEL